MSLELVVALVAAALCLGMLSAVLPLAQRREDIELGLLDEDDFFDLGGPIIDLEPIR